MIHGSFTDFFCDFFEKIICFFQKMLYLCRNKKNKVMKQIRKEMYKQKAEAKHYAGEFANDNGGWVLDDLAFVSNDNDFDYVDRDLANIQWCGETAAFQVVDGSGDLVGLFGYLEAE